jgi:hypothetical protein
MRTTCPTCRTSYDVSNKATVEAAAKITAKWRAKRALRRKPKEVKRDTV